MAYGRITLIQDDPQGGKKGELVDIETGKLYPFAAEKNIPNADRQDIVDFQPDAKGTAIGLVHNIALRVTGFAGANAEVKMALEALIKAQAKDTNDTDIVSRKIK
ncbi:MAG: hypothetical protein ACOZCO_00750 [Bacteroidota bacterium]